MNDKPKAATKTEVYTALSEKTGMTKKQVGTVLDELSNFIKVQIGKKGPGLFVVPGLMKLTLVVKPATKARKGINPFTKEEVMFKAKPARKVVKVRPLKNLKDMVK